jgi:hypothetical protein
MTIYPTINLSVHLTAFSKNHEVNRNNLRKTVIDYFAEERAGHGKGEDTSKYKYIVESLFSNKHVYLTRPVPLNKGFDFIIHVEDYIFMNHKDNPKHEDIINDLKSKKNYNSKAFKKLIKALTEVFLCKDPNDIYSDYKNDLEALDIGLPPDLILKVVKWLFIEQDIRYWNWSGRQMFMNSINDASNKND